MVLIALGKFCRRGHEYNEANTLTVNGVRYCRLCRRMRERSYRNAKNPQCKCGHARGWHYKARKLSACIMCKCPHYEKRE